MSSSLKEMRKAISAHNTKGHYKMGRAQLEDVVVRKMLNPPKMTKKAPKKRVFKSAEFVKDEAPKKKTKKTPKSAQNWVRRSLLVWNREEASVTESRQRNWALNEIIFH